MPKIEEEPSSTKSRGKAVLKVILPLVVEVLVSATALGYVVFQIMFGDKSDQSLVNASAPIMQAIGLAAAAFLIWSLYQGINRLSGALRILLGSKRDAIFHECGHALLFAALRGRHQPNASIVITQEHRFVTHDVPLDFMYSSQARRWARLVCLAGIAAEIAAKRNAKLASDKGFQAVVMRMSGPDHDVSKWNMLAEDCIDSKASNIEGQLDALYEEDMQTLAGFFSSNLSLLKELAAEVESNGNPCEGQRVQSYLDRVVFTDRISPAMFQSPA